MTQIMHVVDDKLKKTMVNYIGQIRTMFCFESCLFIFLKYSSGIQLVHNVATSLM